MAKEIERRFLVQGHSWRGLGETNHFRQGFLSTVKERVVRVRVVGNKGLLTVKGLTRGITKLEFEYAIPLVDAEALLELCELPLIEKKRHWIPYQGLIWAVDEFEGENQGLLLAEIELMDEHQPVDLPDWIGKEISADPRYFNSNLVKNPFSRWRSSP